MNNDKYTAGDNLLRMYYLILGRCDNNYLVYPEPDMVNHQRMRNELKK